MKRYIAFCFGLALISHSIAGETRFYRLVSPAATSITAVAPDGTVTWTNAQTDVTCTVQTSTNLLSGWVDYVQVPISNAVTSQRLFDPAPPAGMVFIPAGSSTMGNCMDTNEGVNAELPLHTVYVSAFYMDRYEVTKAMWDDVYNLAITHSYSFDNAGLGKATTHPVQTVSWYDAVKWCNARSEKENKTPAYYTDAGLGVRYRTGQVAPYVNWSSGYRLPTEAEWEKAARGGASGHRFPWSDMDNITHSRANYYSYWSGGVPDYPYDVNATSGYHPTCNDGIYPYTSPVGYFAPNGYGLYDMAGNLRERCWDWYGSYSSDSQTDPRGPASGSSRVLRGGSWRSYAIRCRTADRTGRNPTLRDNYIGFRSVLPPGQ